MNVAGFKAAVQLALDRMRLYKEDAESAAKLTKEKAAGRKKKVGIGLGFIALCSSGHIYFLIWEFWARIALHSCSFFERG